MKEEDKIDVIDHAKQNKLFAHLKQAFTFISIDRWVRLMLDENIEKILAEIGNCHDLKQYVGLLLLVLFKILTYLEAQGDVEEYIPRDIFNKD